MGKAKTKRCPWDTTATETPEHSWEWETESLKWRWQKGMDFNTRVLLNGKWQSMGWHATLDQAVCYSWGWFNGTEYVGRLNAALTAKQMQEGLTNE